MFWRVFHRSSIGSYLHGADCWAVIALSSIALAEALAKQLADRHFRVLLLLPHNSVTPDNPRGVERGLLRVFVHSLDDIRQEIRLKNVTVFIIDDRLTFSNSATSTSSDQFFQPDTDTHTELYQLLLPTLVENTPSLILNLELRQIGAVDCDDDLFDGEYSMSFSFALREELKAMGCDGVEVVFMGLPRNQKSNRWIRSTQVPDFDIYATSIIHSIGCGQPSIIPYWPHEATAWVAWFLSLFFPQNSLNDILKPALNAIYSNSPNQAPSYSSTTLRR